MTMAITCNTIYYNTILLQNFQLDYRLATGLQPLTTTCHYSVSMKDISQSMNISEQSDMVLHLNFNGCTSEACLIFDCYQSTTVKYIL